MASTYSTSLRLELMATGDQSGTWGDTTNTNLGTLLEQAIAGVLSVAEGDATLTLTALDGASDQSRNMVVELTGAMTAARDVVVPTAEKLYLIKNSTTGGFAVTVKTAAGTGIAVAASTSRWLYCDGTNVVEGGFVALGGDTMTGTLVNTGSTVGYTAFKAVSTEAAAAAGPIIELYRNSASPAASDILGQLLFNGEDSAGNTQEYGSIQAVIADATSGSEDSSLDFYAPVAGARTKIIGLGPNLVLSIGQIAFPATQNPSTDPNTLDDYEEGSFTGTLTGCTTSPTLTIGYVKIGQVVSLGWTGSLTGTSNTTAATITGMPAAIRPATTRYVNIRIRDNGTFAIGLGEIDSSGVITLYATPGAGAFTAAGVKGVGAGEYTYLVT